MTHRMLLLLSACAMFTACLAQEPSTSSPGATAGRTPGAYDSLVVECAKASGVDITGQRPMTAREIQNTTRCIDLVRGALARTQ